MQEIEKNWIKYSVLPLDPAMLKHELRQFKDHVSQRCLVGAVVTSWPLTQEVAGSNPFTVMKNSLITEFSEFNGNI